jgi:hypothetical protein
VQHKALGFGIDAEVLADECGVSRLIDGSAAGKINGGGADGIGAVTAADRHLPMVPDARTERITGRGQERLEP